MKLIHSAILGAVQGITEFLPVSSSGHLVIIQNIFGLKGDILFDCAVHIGTLIAVFVYFFKDIKGILRSLFSFSKEDPDFLLLKDIAAGTFTTAIIGFSFKRFFEKLFYSAKTAAFMLLITGAILALSRFIPEGKKKRVGILNSILIGIAQAAAIIPGISRSGITIVCGLLCGLEREVSARFSFLLSIPAILGAFLLEIKDAKSFSIFPILIGTSVSAIVGFLSLKFLIDTIKRGKLYYFSFYCFLVGIFVAVCA